MLLPTEVAELLAMAAPLELESARPVSRAVVACGYSALAAIAFA